MTPLHSGRSTPHGISCSTNFLPLMMTVCPALWPPAYRATTENLSDSTSTILPLPSSPHWAPKITADFGRFTTDMFSKGFVCPEGCTQKKMHACLHHIAS